MFDLDGVIVDSEPVWEQVRRQVVAGHGGHWLPDAQQRLMGMSTGEWARYLSQDLGTGLPPPVVAATVIERMQARYCEGVPLMPGAAGAVRRLAARWPLGLASSSPPALIDAVLDGAGLRAMLRRRAVDGTGQPRQAGPRHLPRRYGPAGPSPGGVRGGRGLDERAAFRDGRGPAGHRRPAPEVPAGTRRAWTRPGWCSPAWTS